MSQPLVTLLTPCYNTAKYIFRLLDSVLHQTYPNIEMYVIDDGSSDNTKDVIQSYINRFEKKGYLLKYLYQENSGQSVAIQNALKYVKGKYLVWPDSDDFYATDNAIEKMVNVLENAPENVAMVRTQEQWLDENDLRRIGLFGANVKLLEEQSLFEDCLFVKNGYYFAAGAYMVNFQKLISSAEWPMYTAKDAGQNWQLMLPVLWNYRCMSISEVLYSVLVRKSSHSRGQYSGYEKSVVKIEAYFQTALETLDRIKNIPYDVCNKYKVQIKKKYSEEFLMLAFCYGKKDEFKKYSALLPEFDLSSKIMYVYVLLGLSPMMYRVICFKKRIMAYVKKIIRKIVEHFKFIR